MNKDLIEMSISIVTTHLTKNKMSASDVPAFINNIYETLKRLDASSPSSTVMPISTAPASTQHVTEVPSSLAAPEQTTTLPAADVPRTEAPGTAVEASDNREDGVISNKVAYLRDNDLDDPAFKDLDPWLASRISLKVARKLDPKNEIHPSVYPEELICLEDGQGVKLLKAYIKNRYDLTPAEYQDKWNLPDNYPMAPPAYVERKRKLAIKSGLGSAVRAIRKRTKATVEKTGAARNG